MPLIWFSKSRRPIQFIYKRLHQSLVIAANYHTDKCNKDNTLTTEMRQLAHKVTPPPVCLQFFLPHSIPSQLNPTARLIDLGLLR